MHFGLFSDGRSRLYHCDEGRRSYWRGGKLVQFVPLSPALVLFSIARTSRSFATWGDADYLCDHFIT
jgi:hypothetical protein